MNNILPGATQTNLTNWKFCFTYNNINYDEYVEYIPYKSHSTPSPPSSNPPSYTQQHTNYYFVDNYLVFVKMFNQTLTSIYTAMYNANVVAFGVIGLGPNDAPFMLYDDTTERFSLIYNKLFVNNGIDLYFSDTINVLFLRILLWN